MIVRRLALIAATTLAIGAGIVGPGSAIAADPTFSAQPYCHLDQNQQVTESGLSVSFGGADGESFDVFVNDALQGGGPYAFGAGVNIATMSDGQFDVVIKLTGTDDVRFVQTVFIACEAPILIAVASCGKGDTSTISLLITDNAEYLYDIKIDGQTVPGFGAVDIVDLSQDYLSIDGISAGTHTLSADWTAMGTPVDSWSQQILINDCTDAGSGAGGPVVGSNTTPLVAGGALAVLFGGALMIGTRRRRVA